jgi:hypothetical protein
MEVTNRKRWNIRRDSKTGYIRVKPSENGWRDAVDITITSVDYSRNGISGEGFYTVLFTYNGAEEYLKGEKFLAMVFGDEDPDGPFYNCSTGVINMTDLEEKNGNLEWNNWRGDSFDAALRYGIRRWVKADAAAKGWTAYDPFDGVNSNRRREESYA